MGVGISSFKNVSSSAELKKFFSDETLDEDDIENLLNFYLKPPKTIEELRSLKDACKELQIEVGSGNAKNFTALVDYLVNLKDDDDLRIPYNGLFIIKWFLLIISDANDELHEIIKSSEKDLLTFVNSILVNKDINEKNYHLALEASNILEILIDVSPEAASIKEGKELITKLLLNFISQKPAPVFPFQQPPGIGYTLASGMWSVMTVG